MNTEERALLDIVDLVSFARPRKTIHLLKVFYTLIHLGQVLYSTFYNVKVRARTIVVVLFILSRWGLLSKSHGAFRVPCTYENGGMRAARPRRFGILYQARYVT